MQGKLFPALAEAAGELSPNHQRFIRVLSMAAVGRFIAQPGREPGWPQEDRAAIARAIVAEAIRNLPTTHQLRDFLIADRALRRLFGWSAFTEIPSEATFSRAFAERGK